MTTSKSTPGMPQGAQNIRRIEAHGDVTVTTKDQNVSGDTGIYDLESKTITLSGNVVVSQGQNVIHGEKVVVDTVTGNAQGGIGLEQWRRRRRRARSRPRSGADSARKGPRRRFVEHYDHWTRPSELTRPFRPGAENRLESAI